MLHSSKTRHVIDQVKDDTSSLLWLIDPESLCSRQSILTEGPARSHQNIDQTFAFDNDIFNSKAYRQAAKSNMKQAIRKNKGSNIQQKPLPKNPLAITPAKQKLAGKAIQVRRFHHVRFSWLQKTTLARRCSDSLVQVLLITSMHKFPKTMLLEAMKNASVLMQHTTPEKPYSRN